MGKMLLGMAAVAAIGLAAPAAAGSSNDGFSIGGGQGFVSAPGPGGPRDSFRFNGHNGHNGNGDRRRGDDIGLWVNGGEWARWNNQSWQSDSFNDWWHDRPDRAYPAWVRNNQMMQSCRLYYSGGGWRC